MSLSWQRIRAIFLRYFYYVTKFEQLVDLFFWPSLDILLWGITSLWIQSHETEVPMLTRSIITGLVFWQIVLRANNDATVNMLQEFWSRNLVNLFSTPLKVSEWIIGTILIGILKMLIGLAFAAIFIWILFSMNIFTFGIAFLPFAFCMSLFGLTVGYLSSSIIVYYGQRVQMLAWVAPFVFAPFSAIFYPVSILPAWAQWISKALPTSYIFEGMRKVLFEKVFSMQLFLTSLVLDVFYLTLIFILFYRLFEKSRDKGLARLE